MCPGVFPLGETDLEFQGERECAPSGIERLTESNLEARVSRVRGGRKRLVGLANRHVVHADLECRILMGRDAGSPEKPNAGQRIRAVVCIVDLDSPLHGFCTGVQLGFNLVLDLVLPVIEAGMAAPPLSGACVRLVSLYGPHISWGKRIVRRWLRVNGERTEDEYEEEESGLGQRLVHRPRSVQFGGGGRIFHAETIRGSLLIFEVNVKIIGVGSPADGFVENSHRSEF